MNTEEKKITSPQELEKYIGKLVVTHYDGNNYEHSASMRILSKIENTQGKTNLKGCHIYGKFILGINYNNTIDKYFINYTHALYSSRIDYVRLPTTKEKHKFMELYTQFNMNQYKTHTDDTTN